MVYPKKCGSESKIINMPCFEHPFGRKLVKHHSIQETQTGKLRRAWILAIGKRDDVEKTDFNAKLCC